MTGQFTICVEDAEGGTHSLLEAGLQRNFSLLLGEAVEALEPGSRSAHTGPLTRLPYKPEHPTSAASRSRAPPRHTDLAAVRLPTIP